MAVNKAVEIAHQEGILTCASLMMAEGAVDDAIDLARRLPRLGVGLHVTLTNGCAILPPTDIPDLVDRNGRFDDNMLRAGIRYFFSPSVRRQLRSEIRAQFEAFAKTGIPLDHVNAHRHFHLHPTLAAMILEIGREYGAKAIRVPLEPVSVLRLADTSGRFHGQLYMPWVKRLKRRLKRSGIATNDSILGVQWSGAMTENRVVSLLRHLPAGITELYLHPATDRSEHLTQLMPHYHHVLEFKALISPVAKQAISDCGIELVTYRQIVS